MFENDITIQGGPFENQTTFRDMLAKRMNLVYGRN